jgi:PAS domain S-box-containing protein
MHDQQDNPTAKIGYWIDVANGKDISGSLTVSRDSAAESSVNVIAFSDLEWNLTYVNDSFLELWGYTDEKEVFGKPVASFWQTEEKVYEIANAVSANGSWRGQLVAKTRDGSPKDIQLSATMIAGQNGKSVCMMGTLIYVNECRRLEKTLRAREAALKARTTELEEVNSTLRVLLTKRRMDKIEHAKQVTLNVKELVIPCLENLKQNLSDHKQISSLSMLESSINDIVSPFAHELSLRFASLTATELRIAHFVKHGKTSKEMAVLFNVSERTIESHRQKIRLKIGIKNNKANLRSQLMSIQEC